MIFDECTPYPADKVTAEQSMQLSLRWAQRSKDTHQALGNENALFANFAHTAQTKYLKTT
jgi:queuine tRNA-ribosyltransferase